jgi:hypothetical protein
MYEQQSSDRIHLNLADKINEPSKFNSLYQILKQKSLSKLEILLNLKNKLSHLSIFEAPCVQMKGPVLMQTLHFSLLTTKELSKGLSCWIPPSSQQKEGNYTKIQTPLHELANNYKKKTQKI